MMSLGAAFEAVMGAWAILMLLLLIITVARGQQTPLAQPTPAQIERPQPSAKPTKNPHKPHHHYDVRHEHPKIKNPQQMPD